MLSPVGNYNSTKLLGDLPCVGCVCPGFELSWWDGTVGRAVLSSGAGLAFHSAGCLPLKKPKYTCAVE